MSDSKSQLLQAAKQQVRQFQSALDNAIAEAAITAVCQSHLSPTHTYRGVHPFYDIEGGDALADTVWSPLKAAMPVLQRRPDILFAGSHHMDDDNALWVVSMGHFIGDWTQPWLGIKPPMKLTFVPYVSWYKIDNGVIVETVEFLDILSVITQVGHNPYAAQQSAAHIMSPGPLTHDGLLYETQDLASSVKTFNLTNAMLTELAETYTSPAEHMSRHWHTDMTWFGPAGIGGCLGFEGYRRGHTGPFEEQQDFVAYYPETAATAEGNYAAFLWRPCLGMRNTGDYMGVLANEVVAEMRVVDVYRRDGDKLAENWIFIDMLHFMHMQGVDLLAEIRA